MAYNDPNWTPAPGAEFGKTTPTPQEREADMGSQTGNTPDTVQWSGPSDHALKEIVGESIRQVDGILGLKGGVTDIFKKDDDLTRGIKVHVMNQNAVDVSAKVITESGYDQDMVLAQATGNILQSLEERGFSSGEIDVEATDIMTREEFLHKYSEGRAFH